MDYIILLFSCIAEYLIFSDFFDAFFVIRPNFQPPPKPPIDCDSFYRHLFWHQHIAYFLPEYAFFHLPVTSLLFSL